MEAVPWRNRFHVDTVPAAVAGAPPGGACSRKHEQPLGGVVEVDAKKVNIAEVARAAGVGTGTVSRVLNESPNVRAATRARVVEVIEQLGYRPSRLATALSKGTPRSVAIVVPYMTRPSVVERLAGVIAVLDEQGYDAVVLNVETAEQRDRHLDSLTERHRVDGVVVVSLPVPARHLAAFQGSGIPLVLVDADAPGVVRTVTDDVEGGRLATAHLVELGHRRIGFVGDLGYEGIGNASTRQRFLGYTRALAAVGVGVDVDLVRQGAHGAHTAALLAEQMLRSPRPPTAIFAISDTQAIGVLGAADRLGVAVPEELSVVGYDDIESAAFLGLTTVRQSLARSGEQGAGRLCALLRGEPVRPRRQQIGLEVVARSSSARRRASGRVHRASADDDAGPAGPASEASGGPADWVTAARLARRREGDGAEGAVLRA